MLYVYLRQEKEIQSIIEFENYIKSKCDFFRACEHKLCFNYPLFAIFICKIE